MGKIKIILIKKVIKGTIDKFDYRKNLKVENQTKNSL